MPLPIVPAPTTPTRLISISTSRECSQDPLPRNRTASKTLECNTGRASGQGLRPSVSYSARSLRNFLWGVGLIDNRIVRPAFRAAIHARVREAPMSKLGPFLPCVALFLIVLSLLACGGGNRQLQSMSISPANGATQAQFTAIGK